MYKIIFFICLPFLSFGQHYEQLDTIPVKTKFIEVKHQGKTLLVKSEVAKELKLKHGQMINTREDFYYIMFFKIKK